MSKENTEPNGWTLRRESISRRIELVTLKMCLENGISNTTVEEIATNSGISKRTFYRYFTTIDEVLTASPQRALERISRGVRERPAEEGIREAFVRGGYKWAPSEEEREIQVMGAQLARLEPAEWFRAIDRMEPSGREVYEQLVVERLNAVGKDPGLAPLITDVLLAVIKHVSITHREDGKFAARADHLEAAFHSVADVLAT